MVKMQRMMTVRKHRKIKEEAPEEDDEQEPQTASQKDNPDYVEKVIKTSKTHWRNIQVRHIGNAFLTLFLSFSGPSDPPLETLAAKPARRSLASVDYKNMQPT